MSRRKRLASSVAALGSVVVMIGAVLLWRHDDLAVTFSPGTQSGGAVSIATDHGDYLSSGPMQMTVQNHLSSTIYLLAGASCSSFTVQGQYKASWGKGYYNMWDACAKPIPITTCFGIGNTFGVPLGSTPIPVVRWRIIQLLPGASYHQSLYPPFATTIHPDPVPTGAYRLAVFYANEPIDPTVELPDVRSDGTLPEPFGVAYSATLHIQQDASEVPQHQDYCA